MVQNGILVPQRDVLETDWFAFLFLDTFSETYPAQAVSSEENVTEALEDKGLASKTILVVEDNALLLEFVHDLLDTYGYRLLLAGNAQEAIEYLENQGQPIDLIFSDIRIPGGMDGISLVRKAKVLRKNLKVLLTTGFAPELLEKSLEKEFQIIQKPYEPKVLAQTIRMVLERP